MIKHCQTVHMLITNVDTQMGERSQVFTREVQKVCTSQPQQTYTTFCHSQYSFSQLIQKLRVPEVSPKHRFGYRNILLLLNFFAEQ